MGKESPILSETGRYAGARGSYVARQLPLEFGGDGTADLVVTIALDGTASTTDHYILRRER